MKKFRKKNLEEYILVLLLNNYDYRPNSKYAGKTKSPEYLDEALWKSCNMTNLKLVLKHMSPMMPVFKWSKKTN